MNWDWLEIARQVVYGYIMFSLFVGMVVGVLIWVLTKSLETGKLETDVAGRTWRRRNWLIRFAARHGLWGTNYSLIEQVRITDLLIGMGSEIDGETPVEITFVDQYGTSLRMDIDAEAIVKTADIYKKMNSPETKEQIRMVREAFAENLK